MIPVGKQQAILRDLSTVALASEFGEKPGPGHLPIGMML
jgi:hypothetical protein